MGLLDLIAAPSPERARQTLADLVRGPQNRLRGLLDDPAGFMGSALREGLGADDMERRWAWNQNRLDAMTGSDYTRASVDNSANRAALNLGLMGAIRDIPAMKWDKTGRMSIPVGVNPSPSELRELFREQNELRALVPRGGGDQYVWPADQALHQDIGAFFRLDPRSYEHGLLIK